MAKKATSRKSASKSESKSKARSSSRSDDKRRRRENSALGARPVWTGNVRLALVSVPVRLYPATKSGARISFHQVHEPSGKRIRYQKVAPGVGPVDTDEIVKGFEIEKGRYVLFEPEELDELKLEARKTLDLVQFVQQGEIDPIWFDRPYYVVPDGDLAEEPYVVMRDAMRSMKRLGLGQFIMRGREYIAALKPCGQGLLLETLRFADEVRNAAPFFSEVGESDTEEELQSLAEELIERKTAAFDPKQFQDSYTVALRELIEAKAKSGKPIEVEEQEEPSGGGAQVIDLMEALKRSVKSDKGKAPAKAAAAKSSAGTSRSAKAASAKSPGTRRKAG